MANNSLVHIANKKISLLKKLLKSKTAIAALLIIAIALFFAFFGYLIAPDNSENANRIIPEVGSKKPGYTCTLLQLKKTTIEAGNNNFFKVLIRGKIENYTYIPITSYTISADSIVFNKLIDDNITEKQVLHLKNSDYSIKKVKFYLGTDKFGRDILSRLIIGVRVSLSVGLIAVLISLSIGIFLGAVAGYFKGKIDDVIMWFVNVVWSIPTLLLVFAITLVLGKGFWQVFIAVGLTMWVNVARLVRGQILAIKQLEYVQAAKALGYSNARIIVRHILPNIIGPIMVIAASNFASAIVVEAGLSFLGVGVQPPQPSWGLMIQENYNFIITHNAMLAIIPGIAIMLLVLAFNLLGNSLRDALNVRQKL